MEQVTTGQEERGREAKTKDKLKVRVFAPRFPDKPKKFTWLPGMIVSAAAEEAAAAFGYGRGTQTLAKDGNALDRNKSLAAVGVRDGDELMLVDIGGGV